jgi:hypothetical protein
MRIKLLGPVYYTCLQKLQHKSAGERFIARRVKCWCDK